MLFANRFEVSIRSLWVEDFIAVHHCYQVLSIREVYDVVGVAGEHVDTLDILTRDFEFYDFVRVYTAFLNEAVT